MRFDVICFGALNLDRLCRVDRIAREDEESTVIEVEEYPGGSAANTAVGLARLGLKVGYVGKVSRDREGEILVRSLKDEGVNTGGVVVSKTGRSGVVYGYVDRSGNRALYVDPGVNSQLDFGEIDIEYVSSTKFLHLSSFVGERAFRAQLEVLKVLPERVKVSLDPGNIYARKGLESLSEMLDRCYVVMPSEFEVKLITGKRDIKEGAEKILSLGPSIVAVKLGSRGCYVTNGDESHFIGAFKVKVVDTTGAGDAFNAGFLYGVLKGRGILEAGRLGNFVASRCITSRGARAGLPSEEDVKRASLI
ncbi:hypothetical protein CP083_01960 [Candidatus Bathyarchaeota archaeon B24-2]|nr:MAG: hypothetical protein CP083_01960 [Candidatus Bathyarchaeota archaeon B24-2]